MIEKTDGAWKCRACKTMWHGRQLYRSPYHFAWTCGDLECGGTVDDYTATKEGHEFLEAAEQKMHLTLGESAASDSESTPAPKQVI